MKRSILAIFLVISLVMSLVVLGCAEPEEPKEYPWKSIDLILAYKPGGGADFVGHVMAGIAPDYFGQTWYVRSHAGGKGGVATKYILDQPADGYTLSYMGVSGNLWNTMEIPYTPADLRPIHTILYMCGAITVNADFPHLYPWENMVGYVLDNPGEVTLGMTSTLMSKWLEFERAAGIDGKVTLVPYETAPDVMTDLLGKHIHMGLTSAQAAASSAEAGKLVPIMVVSEEADIMKAYEGVAIPRDFGYDIIPEAVPLMVHADTPLEIIQKLSAILTEMFADESLRAACGRGGYFMANLDYIATEKWYWADAQALYEIFGHQYDRKFDPAWMERWER